MKTHFGGRLQWLTGRVRTIIMPGHAACGRQTGKSSRKATEVTCGTCRNLLRKSEARIAWRKP